MLTGRAHRLSPFVHLVDDGGALCGATPRGDRWVKNDGWPVTCPKCLLQLGTRRFAVCELPGGSVAGGQTQVIHIRELGPEGLSKRGVAGMRTLCGQPAGWDIDSLGPEWLRYRFMCGHCRRLFGRATDPLAIEKSRRARLVRVKPERFSRVA